MIEFYTYEIFDSEQEYYRIDDPAVAKDTFTDRLHFAEWELTRAKAWANCIATDWDKAVKFKRAAGIELEPHQTQETCYMGAVNWIICCQHRVKRIKRDRKHKPKRKAKKT